MVEVSFHPRFQLIISKIKDDLMREKIKKQIKKIRVNPKIGKPMKNERKGTRELYIKPFRLSYAYSISEDKAIILDLYHKKKQ